MTSGDRKEPIQPLDLLSFPLRTGWGWGDRCSGSPGGGKQKGEGRGKTFCTRFPCLFVMETRLTEYRINQLKANNSLAFSTFTVVCKHHLCSILKHFDHPKRRPHTH